MHNSFRLFEERWTGLFYCSCIMIGRINDTSWRLAYSDYIGFIHWVCVSDKKGILAWQVRALHLKRPVTRRWILKGRGDRAIRADQPRDLAIKVWLDGREVKALLCSLIEDQGWHSNYKCSAEIQQTRPWLSKERAPRVERPRSIIENGGW